jgi:hypothetical protein
MAISLLSEENHSTLIILALPLASSDDTLCAEAQKDHQPFPSGSGRSWRLFDMVHTHQSSSHERMRHGRLALSATTLLHHAGQFVMVNRGLRSRMRLAD